MALACNSLCKLFQYANNSQVKAHVLKISQLRGGYVMLCIITVRYWLHIICLSVSCAQSTLVMSKFLLQRKCRANNCISLETQKCRQSTLISHSTNFELRNRLDSCLSSGLLSTGGFSFANPDTFITHYIRLSQDNLSRMLGLFLWPLKGNPLVNLCCHWPEIYTKPLLVTNTSHCLCVLISNLLQGKSV